MLGMGCYIFDHLFDVIRLKWVLVGFQKIDLYEGAIFFCKKVYFVHIFAKKFIFLRFSVSVLILVFYAGHPWGLVRGDGIRL